MCDPVDPGKGLRTDYGSELSVIRGTDQNSAGLYLEFYSDGASDIGSQWVWDPKESQSQS